MSRVAAWMLMAGIAGAWLLSLAANLYDAAFRPEVLRDGQYAFTFITTVPVGWLVATLGAAGAAAVRRTDRDPSNGQLVRLVIGAVVLTPVVLAPLLPGVALSLGLVIQAVRGLRQ